MISRLILHSQSEGPYSFNYRCFFIFHSSSHVTLLSKTSASQKKFKLIADFHNLLPDYISNSFYHNVPHRPYSVDPVFDFQPLKHSPHCLKKVFLSPHPASFGGELPSILQPSKTYSSRDSMDETGKYYSKRKKPVTKVCGCIYMKCSGWAALQRRK